MALRIRPVVGGERPGQVVFDRVRYRYKGSDTTAVADVSAQIEPGELVAVVGRNGSGKSTLIRMANGLLRPESGSVRVGAADIAHLRVSEISRSVGFVFQNPDRQIFASSVLSEVTAGLRAQGLDRSAAEERALTALRELHLEQHTHRHPSVLSGGQRQSLALACVLAMDPPILVLDEPTTGLDPSARNNVVRLLQRAENGRARTILMVTHDMRLVAAHADRVLVLYQGRLLACGPPLALFADLDLMARSGLRPPPEMEVMARLSDPPSPVGARQPSPPAAGPCLSRRTSVQ